MQKFTGITLSVSKKLILSKKCYLTTHLLILVDSQKERILSFPEQCFLSSESKNSASLVTFTWTEPVAGRRIWPCCDL